MDHTVHGNIRSVSEYWNIVVYLGAVALSNAFGNPDNVATLLFLQLDIGVEDAIVELVHERELVQLNLQSREGAH